MKTKFDIGDTLYLPVTLAEIKILENGQEVYKVNVPGCGPCFWYSPEDFLVFNAGGMSGYERQTG